MARITLSLNGNILREVALAKERMTIGRGPGNDILLDNLAVSAEHAVIVTHDDDSFLEDLNSTNGTQVNGQPIKKHFLQDEDVIEIAQYRIRYSVESVAEMNSTDSDVARIAIINGPGAGKEIMLTKALTTIGRPGVQIAAIARRNQGYYVIRVEGNLPLNVNGSQISTAMREMADGDIIDIAGTRMQFVTK